MPGKLPQSTPPREPSLAELPVEPPQARPVESSIVVGVTLLVYAAILLVASFALWSYAENIFIWAWLYSLFKLVLYTPYALILKILSATVGLLGLLAILAGLILIVDGVAHQRSSQAG